MKRVIALEFVTLDGVIRAGGGPDEDRSGGFWHHHRELRAGRRNRDRKLVNRTNEMDGENR